MAKVYTLGDFEPTTTPLPNPWTEGSTGGGSSYEPVGEYNQTTQIGYLGVNGEMKYATPSSPTQTALLVCCPCFVNPCGDERKSEYFQVLFLSLQKLDSLSLKMLKSFCVLLGILQVILLIVALCLGGFAPPSRVPFFFL